MLIKRSCSARPRQADSSQSAGHAKMAILRQVMSSKSHLWSLDSSRSQRRQIQLPKEVSCLKISFFVISVLKNKSKFNCRPTRKQYFYIWTDFLRADMIRDKTFYQDTSLELTFFSFDQISVKAAYNIPLLHPNNLPNPSFWTFVIHVIKSSFSYTWLSFDDASLTQDSLSMHLINQRVVLGY